MDKYLVKYIMFIIEKIINKYLIQYINYIEKGSEYFSRESVLRISLLKVTMKFCSKCGNQLNGTEKFCGKCGKRLDEIDNSKSDSTLKNDFHNQHTMIQPTVNAEKSSPITETTIITKNNNKSNKKEMRILSCVLISLILIIAVVTIIFKDDFTYKYHVYKAQKAEQISEKLKEYSLAMEVNHTDEIVNNVYDILKDETDFDEKLSNLENTFNEEEFAKIYRGIYSYKGQRAFEDKDYDKSLKLFNKAEEYGYDTDKFAYYDELKKQIKKEEVEDKEEKIAEDVIVTTKDFIIYDSNQRYLEYSELEQYNKDALALIRNEIFARHGYEFQTEPFKTYFASRKWYKPNPNYKGDESVFNEYEKSNIKLILDLENK